MTNLDYSIVIFYAIALLLIAYKLSNKENASSSAENNYFLAGSSLPWWAIGASLIAANISAEQIIGMSGSGYAIGMAIASYEWMAAVTLLLVGKYLLPIFLERKIYTMPQFLDQRYDHRVRLTMSIFWIGVYVFVNLTSILWLGALAIETITGINLVAGMFALGSFSLIYSVYGGLRVVAFTDIIQVVLLIFGGLLVVYVLLQEIGGEGQEMAAFLSLAGEVPSKFDMILSKGDPNYASLPGISVLLGGMWIMNLSYWGFNQYIIQRALAAKNLAEAQKGIIFAAFLKILMPIIVVLPGILVFIVNSNLESPDQAYPTAMSFLPVGIKGLVFAALMAAIVSSLSSMSNSIATIFTVDVLPRIGKLEASDPILIGRISAVIAMVVAMSVAKPLLGNFDQAFQYIQEFTGFFTPGIVAIFLLGIMSPRVTANGALTAAIGSAVFSLLGRLLFPDIPFMDRVAIVFVLCVVSALLVSRGSSSQRIDSRFFDLSFFNSKTNASFNLLSCLIVLIVGCFYVVWW